MTYSLGLRASSPAHQIDSQRFGFTLCGLPLGSLQPIPAGLESSHVVCRHCARIAAARARRRIVSAALLSGCFSFGGGAA